MVAYRQFFKVKFANTHALFCEAFGLNRRLCYSVAENRVPEKVLSSTHPMRKSLKIAVIGVPNAGKSTFINNIINHRICPISSKVHTTVDANKAVCTEGNTQLIYFDTPGLVTPSEIKKHNLGQSFKKSYRHAIQHADVIAVLHDASNKWTRRQLHSTVLDTLNNYQTIPSFLILNKIDLIKSKRVLLDLVNQLTNNTLSSKALEKRHQTVTNNDENNKTAALENWSHFSNIFLVSALSGDGLNKIQDYLFSQAKPREWEYPDNVYTDKTPESLIVESVRARLLEHFPQELPYLLQCALEYYAVENKTIFASVQVACPTERIERLICGAENGKLKYITERITSDLVETFSTGVSLTITTKAIKKKQKRY